MSEELNNQPNIQPETQEVNPTQEQPVEEQKKEESIQLETAPVETIQAKNFRELRNTAQQLKRERDEAIGLLQQQADKNKAAAQEIAAQEEDLRLKDDELVEGKHLSKFQKKITRLEDQLKNYEVKSSELAIESRLRSKYTDFDKVVNNDNVALLKEHYPELAQTINSSTDLYSKAVTAYTLIKKLNLLPDPELQQEQQLAKKNLAKPGSLASVSPQQGNSPLSRANAFEHGLTEELKEQLRKEMFEARKGY